MPKSNLVVLQAQRLLTDLGVTEPPFPVADAVALANLRFAPHALDELPDDTPDHLQGQLLIDAMDHAFGLLDRHQSLIYLKANMIRSRQHFVTMHEVGHHWLPWQRRHGIHVDGERNLDQDTKDLYEWQANVFASETLFLGTTLSDRASELPFELKSAMQLAGDFGTSLHATLRRYVETHHQRCFLLVLDRTADVRGRPPRHRVRQQITSAPFRRAYPRWRTPSVAAADVHALIGRSAPTTLSAHWGIEGTGEIIRVVLQGLDNGHHLLLFGRPVDGQSFPRPIKVRQTRL